MVDIFIPKRSNEKSCQSFKPRAPSSTVSDVSNISEIQTIRSDLRRIFPTITEERLRVINDIAVLKAVKAEALRRNQRKSLLSTAKGLPYPTELDGIHLKVRTVKRVVRHKVKPALTSRELGLRQYAEKAAAVRDAKRKATTA